LIIFSLAILVSAGLSVFIPFRVEGFGGTGDTILIILFFFSSNYAFFEIFKWPLGKRKIDNSSRLKSHLFGDIEDTWWWSVFPRESVISAKTKKEIKVVWINFLYSLWFMSLTLWELVK
jgi:hypothetical protein